MGISKMDRQVKVSAHPTRRIVHRESAFRVDAEEFFLFPLVQSG